jgi:hypothetical protein
MRNVICKTDWEIVGSDSIIGFETTGGGQWKEWDRFLNIDGKKAYHIGNICGTCSFFFERLEGANKSISPHDVSDILGQGLGDLPQNLLHKVSKILPNGKYLISLLKISPSLIELGSDKDYFNNEQVKVWGVDGFWGLPHHPKIQYYRGLTKEISSGEKLFEFIVPMFPQNWLDMTRVNHFKQILQEGFAPTALALSVLDIKEPADCEGEEEMESHFCLAHYLIDGHHKTFASAQLNKPITLLSFLSVEQGISTEDEIKRVFVNEL